jgi:preprotein translocase subunit YajC
MFQVLVTTNDISTSVENMRTENATHIDLSQEAQTQTDIVLSELADFFRKQKRKIKELKETVDRLKKRHGIEKRSLLGKVRDLREEIVSLKVSLNTKVIQCSINGFCNHCIICLTFR